MKIIGSLFLIFVVMGFIAISGCVSTDNTSTNKVISKQETQNVTDNQKTTVKNITPKVTAEIKESSIKKCGDYSYDANIQSCCNDIIVINKTESCNEIITEPHNYGCVNFKDKQGELYLLNYCNGNDGKIRGYRQLVPRAGQGGAQVVASIIAEVILQIQREIPNYQDFSDVNMVLHISLPIINNGMIDVPLMRGSLWNGHVNVSSLQPIDKWVVDSMNLDYKNNGKILSIKGNNIVITPSYFENTEWSFTPKNNPLQNITVKSPEYQVNFEKLVLINNEKSTILNNITYFINSSVGKYDIGNLDLLNAENNELVVNLKN